MPFKCDTVCFRSIQFWSLFGLDRVNGSVLVGGVNFNNYISIQRNKDLLTNVLQGGPGPLQQLNQQFVALQLSLIYAGGTGSPVVFNTFWSPLSCSGIDFTPVTLSNGVTLSRLSLLDTLFNQTLNAIKENRTQDMAALASIIALLNGRC